MSARPTVYMTVINRRGVSKNIWGAFGVPIEYGGTQFPDTPGAHHLAGTGLGQGGPAGPAPRPGPRPRPQVPRPRPPLHSYGAAEAAAILAPER